MPRVDSGMPVVGANVSRVFQGIGATQEAVDHLLGRYRFQRGDQVVEHQDPDFGGLLSSGERPGFTIASSRAVIEGAPGTICTSQVIVTGTAILRDITFHCDGNIPALVITETGRCVISNCHFFKASGVQSVPGDHYITVEASGVLNVVACMFHGAQTAGFVVSNPAPAPITNVDVTGCVNLSGRTHDNVTIVGEAP